MRGLKIVTLAVALVVAAVAATGGIRGLLWHTVQACVLDHHVTGSPFPCLAVSTDPRPGYVVLRSPLDESHVVLSPATRVAGIEAPALRAPDARTYLADAWRERAFAYPAGVSAIPPSDMALAINARWGRTQDQLHIHIDCLRPGVKARILRVAPAIVAGRWSKIDPADWKWAQPYWATALGDRLDATNAVAAAAAGLGLGGEDVHKLSIAVVATSDAPDHPAFILLAQAARSETSRDGHAEEVMDHDCADYRSRVKR